jgi:hypothetical protein
MAATGALLITLEIPPPAEQKWDSGPENGILLSRRPLERDLAYVRLTC